MDDDAPAPSPAAAPAAGAAPGVAAGVSPAVPAADRELRFWQLYQVVLAGFVGLTLATPIRDMSYYALGLLLVMLLIDRKQGAPMASGRALLGMTVGAALGLALFVQSLHSMQAGVLRLADRTPHVLAQASMGLAGMGLGHLARRSGSAWSGLGPLAGGLAALVLDLVADPFL